MNIVEVYLVPEKYNPRVRASIPGCWMAVRNDGNEFPICADYVANNADEALAIVNLKQVLRGN